MTQTADPLDIVSPEKELRKSPRMKRCEEVAITLHENGVDTRARVALQDLSPSGFSFCFSRRVEAGALCSITLPRAQEQPIVIISKVANCRPMADGTFRIGCMFMRTIARGPARRH